MNSGTTAEQANVEYFFRLLYDCMHGGCYGSPNLAPLLALLAQIWMWIIYIGYALSIIGLFMIIYSTVRIFELRKREEEYYGTVILAPDAEAGGHPRWEHIKELSEGSSPSEWREAIIEADILLDETLTRAGYAGESVSDKLKNADHVNFSSIQDAWEAHKVRNQIAHEGSRFDLTEQLARRTIARYETVFREFKVVS
ncbi:hypothetical protein KGM48_01880 [Patescibacteria group bacterium]|nr:hypothetical protein [Patescibacteria group bacterium]